MSDGCDMLYMFYLEWLPTNTGGEWKAVSFSIGTIKRQILWPPCSRKTRTHLSFPLAAEKWRSVQPLASRILGEYPCSSILLTVYTSPAATAAWICSSSWSSGFLLQWWFSILSHFREECSPVSQLTGADGIAGYANVNVLPWPTYCTVNIVYRAPGDTPSLLESSVWVMDIISWRLLNNQPHLSKF